MRSATEPRLRLWLKKWEKVGTQATRTLRSFIPIIKSAIAFYRSEDARALFHLVKSVLDID